jgi:hypothetical protein
VSSAETSQPDNQPPSDLGRYVLEFTRALQRYRTTTILGWMITAAGFASLVLGWRAGSLRDMLDLSLSCFTMIGGVWTVHVSVQSLEAHVKLSLHALETTGGDVRMDGLRAELAHLMSEVHEGGWQEAFAALRRLRELAGQERPAQDNDSLISSHEGSVHGKPGTGIQ